MITKRFKFNRIAYSYHPDFVQDDNEPKGYRILPTGKWVVEWVVREFYPTDEPEQPKHCKRSFPTEAAAKFFENQLRHRLDEKNSMLVGNENIYFLSEE